MKTIIAPEILNQQRYRCNQCSKGCRSFLVGLRSGEAEAIEALQDWHGSLRVEELFAKNRRVPRTHLALAKREDGRCVFLGDDNLCEIHRHYGMAAKPFACQLYPFVLTPVAGKWRVGLRFDCPQVCRNEGEALSSYYQGVGRLSEQLAGSSGLGVAENIVPELLRGVKITASQFEFINTILIKMVSSNAMGLMQRLEWLRTFAEHLAQVKWACVTEEDFPELIKMFEGSLLAEVSQAKLVRQPPGKRARKLMGHIFFLLSQPAQDRASQAGGWFQRFSQRWAKAAELRQLGGISGPLPTLQAHWPNCDLRELETSFGAWPGEVDSVIERYLLCRVGGMNYCGPAFYGYSLVEGVQSLLLASATVGWLMRITALKAGRECLTVEDAYQAIMTIDGNMGYSHALGMSASRLRLEYLSSHLGGLVRWYGG